MHSIKNYLKSDWLFFKDFWIAKWKIILSVIVSFIIGAVFGNGFAMKNERLFSDWFSGITTLIAALVALWLGLRKEKPKLAFSLVPIKKDFRWYRLTIYNQEQKVNTLEMCEPFTPFESLDITNPDNSPEWKNPIGTRKNVRNSWLVLSPCSADDNKDCGQLDIIFDKYTNYAEIVFLEKNTNKKIKVIFSKEGNLWKIKY